MLQDDLRCFGVNYDMSRITRFLCYFLSLKLATVLFYYAFPSLGRQGMDMMRCHENLTMEFQRQKINYEAKMAVTLPNSPHIALTYTKFRFDHFFDLTYPPSCHDSYFDKVRNFKLGMLPSCSSLLTDFRTIFVFALGPFLPMKVIFFDYNGNFNGKMVKINKMANLKFPSLSK